MVYIAYKSNRNGGLDIRTSEGKRGEIKKRGGEFQAKLTRPVSLEELQGVVCFVGYLNRG